MLSSPRYTGIRWLCSNSNPVLRRFGVILEATSQERSARSSQASGVLAQKFVDKVLLVLDSFLEPH